MRPWDGKRALLEEAKCHWAIASAIVAAAASAYSTSKQASAAKKSKLAAANAAVSSSGGGGGAPAQTIASQTPSIGRDAIGKLPSELKFLDTPGDLPGGSPGNLGDLPQGRSYGDMLALSPGPTQAPGSGFQPDEPAPMTKEVPYQDAMGMNDDGKAAGTGAVKQYADLAGSALPLILALTQGNAPQAAPRPQVSPYSYTPTALTYRQRMGF